MQLIASVAALAATITSVNALGNAIVNNNCAFPIYLWPTDTERNPSQAVTVAPGGSWSEPYHAPASGGVSIKINKQNSKSNPTQFEYTVASFGASSLWYDGSHVDCVGSACPFYEFGINLKASDPSCPTRDCPIGQVCSGFYTLWNDDINTLSCASSANTIFTVCSINQGGDSGSPAQKPAEKPAAAPTTTKAAIVNEAVLTTFATKYAEPTKRSEPVHHGHMHFHQRSNQE
jgi:hypothetical protein